MVNLYLVFISLWLWAVIADKSYSDPCEGVYCSNYRFDISHLKGFKALSIENDPSPGYTTACVCTVTFNITHFSAYDNVFMPFDLPNKGWNQPFAGMGGGKFAVGRFDHKDLLEMGFAVGSTDGGHLNEHHGDASWVLYKNRTVNWNLLDNFAHGSLVDLINIGKIITTQYCERSPDRTYWFSCSN